jgi:hypothetical protein
MVRAAVGVMVCSVVVYVPPSSRLMSPSISIPVAVNLAASAPPTVTASSFAPDRYSPVSSSPVKDTPGLVAVPDNDLIGAVAENGSGIQSCANYFCIAFNTPSHYRCR